MFSTTTMILLAWLAAIFVFIGAIYRFSTLTDLRKERYLLKEIKKYIDLIESDKKYLADSRRYYVNLKLLEILKTKDLSDRLEALRKLYKEVKYFKIHEEE